MALTDNLISYWELGEASGTRNDSHSTNHLTDNNTVTQAAGKVGNAAQFTKANSEYLSRASNAELQMGDIDFSFCAWVYLDSIPANLNSFSLVTKDSDAANSRDYTFDYGRNDTTPANGGFRFYVNGGPNYIPSGFAASTATWYFVVLWRDDVGGTLNIQVNDGTVQSASNGGLVPQTTSAEFRIGARQYSAVEDYHDGRIDQVGIWKRLLTSDERTALYNSGNGRSYASMVSSGFFARRYYDTHIARQHV